MPDWFDSPAGRYLLDWEQDCLDRAVADVFGYHALQLGLPALDALRANRMPHRWLAVADMATQTAASAAVTPAVDLVTDFSALPFQSACLDLMVLPHVLEHHPDPHATLREVERVLVPEGRVMVAGINPFSLWGLREYRARMYRRAGQRLAPGLGWGELYLPPARGYIHPWRLRDWLRLLGFDIETCHFGCYRPAVRSDRWLARFAWMDRLGARSWPVLGAAYFMVAVKRVHGMRLLEPSWKTKTAPAGAPVPVARRQGDRNHIAITGTDFESR